MALPPSTANWHWKNKNVTGWGKEWFARQLTLTITGEAEGEEVKISEVTEVDGDIELGQRKSKLITIYDCKIVLKWTGTASDGTEVNGTLTIPEVSHEITLDGLSDYTFNWTLDTPSSPAVDVLFALAKSHLRTTLETKFAEFPTALIDTHGKDLTISADPSRTGTPAPTGTSTPASAPPSAATPVKKVEAKAKAVNTSTVSVEATFMIAADDLFALLTDEKRIPSWTRAPAQSTAQPESTYSLFGGGVRGKYISLTPPKEIIQTWALQSPTWPSGHDATLTTSIVQSSDSTKVTFALAGVPSGMEDEIKRNLEGYYIHGFKAIGYVQLFASPPSRPSASSRNVQRQSSKHIQLNTGLYDVAMVLAVLVLFIAAFCWAPLFERGIHARIRLGTMKEIEKKFGIEEYLLANQELWV